MKRRTHKKLIKNTLVYKLLTELNRITGKIENGYSKLYPKKNKVNVK